MNNYALQTDRAQRRKEMAKGFLLTIRADDGSTKLQTNVEYIHQAFQRLIDWSTGDVGQDVSAVISGPNGFYTNHRIKALQDFAWIEEEKAEFKSGTTSCEPRLSGNADKCLRRRDDFSDPRTTTSPITVIPGEGAAKPNIVLDDENLIFGRPSPDQSLMSRHRLKVAQREFYSRLNCLAV
jgi:hypothetical protein